MGVALYFIHIINDKTGLEKLVSTIHILSKFFIFHGFSLEKDYSVNLMPSYEYTDPTGFIWKNIMHVCSNNIIENAFSSGYLEGAVEDRNRKHNISCF